MTVLTDVNIRIELMRMGFPDCIAHRYDVTFLRVNYIL